MARLPVPGSDDGTWGNVLNDYLSQSLNTDGTLKPNSVSAAALQSGSVNTSKIQDSTVTEAKLHGDVQDKLNAVSAGGSTNLSTSTSASTVTVASDTGTDAVLGAATPSAAGVLSAADKTTIDSIAPVAISGSYADLSNRPTIPVQFNPIAGTNVTLSGTYPNVTINATPGAGVTDLSSTTSSTNVTVVSSTGNDATLAAASTSNAGVMSAADKTKLDGVATNATANSSDATLLSRTNHTGSQAISTVTDLQTALDDKEDAGSITTHQSATDPHAAADYAIMVGGGRRIFVQATDPGGAASDGDLWIDTSV